MDERAIRTTVRNGLERRRQAIVYSLAKRFYQLFSPHTHVANPSAAPKPTDWSRIESLSQLRSTVGGRFQKLKERWLAAGFPLREHKGDRAENATVDYDGWVELSNWISKQGFEVRLAAEDADWLLEVRKIEPES